MQVKERIVNKIKQNRGESLAETLISLVIASFGMMILAGAIIASSKVMIKSNTDFFSHEDLSGSIAQASATIKFQGENISFTASDAIAAGLNTTTSVTVYKYTDGDDYYYYYVPVFADE
ncbi:MAG: hypothetical protein E7304_09605 [Butyrivibrio sp.]|jgi:Tfp pilus assembly protein PilV|uniref:hypothetical protein n=1 Tax=Butyrivibrio sp. TaxID=28121 RepID=UPI001EBFA40F|nr:hypothetical protein [Butyrivibrio sp.]MBE5841650.1 hypothetical protein [Butyrivibrio sp.]